MRSDGHQRGGFATWPAWLRRAECRDHDRIFFAAIPDEQARLLVMFVRSSRVTRLWRDMSKESEIGLGSAATPSDGGRAIDTRTNHGHRAPQRWHQMLKTWIRVLSRLTPHSHAIVICFVFPFLDLGRSQQRFLLTQTQRNATQCKRHGTFYETASLSLSPIRERQGQLSRMRVRGSMGQGNHECRKEESAFNMQSIIAVITSNHGLCMTAMNR
jgi:hypothetical protein